MLLSLLFSSAVSMALTNSQPAKDAFFDSVVSITVDGRNQKPLTDRIKNHLGMNGPNVEDSEEASGICTATLLSPRILITAAHCTLQAYALNLKTIQLRMGRQKIVTNGRTGLPVDIGYANYFDKAVEVQAFGLLNSLKNRVNRGASIYGNIPSREDISLIVLKDSLDLPADFPFAKIMSYADFTEFQGRRGQLRGVMVTSVNYWDEMSQDRKRYALLEDMRWQSGDFYYSQSKAHVQPTDSGGPVFGKMYDGWKLMGVVKGSVTRAFVYTNDIYNGVGIKVCEMSANTPSLTSAEKALICR